jgi:hypothetical protein
MVFLKKFPPHFWRLKTSKITYLAEFKIVMSVVGKISPILKNKNKFNRVLKALLQASRTSLNTSSPSSSCVHREQVATYTSARRTSVSLRLPSTPLPSIFAVQLLLLSVLYPALPGDDVHNMATTTVKYVDAA